MGDIRADVCRLQEQEYARGRGRDACPRGSYAQEIDIQEFPLIVFGP